MREESTSEPVSKPEEKKGVSRNRSESELLSPTNDAASIKRPASTGMATWNGDPACTAVTRKSYRARTAKKGRRNNCMRMPPTAT